ncbi:MAG: LamG-like jellyroll fold domain-containing protein, partial [Thermodesulfobacteriota bacterium]
RVEIVDRSNNVGQREVTAANTGEYHHYAGTADKSTFELFKDGTSEGTTAEAHAIEGDIQDVDIGERSDGGFNYDGILSDCAMWSVVLSDAEINALSNGIPPKVIRPDSILGYWPLYGSHSPEPDWSGNGENGTITGTAKAEHAPVQLLQMYMP